MSDDPFVRLRALSEPGAIIDPDMLARLLEALPDAVFVIDANGTIQLVNAQCELIFGYHRSEMLGQTIEMLLPESVRERHIEHRRRFFMDPRVRPMGLGTPLQGLHRNRTAINLEINLSPIVTQRGTYAVAVVRKRRDADA